MSTDADGGGPHGPDLSWARPSQPAVWDCSSLASCVCLPELIYDMIPIKVRFFSGTGPLHARLCYKQRRAARKPLRRRLYAAGSCCCVICLRNRPSRRGSPPQETRGVGKAPAVGSVRGASGGEGRNETRPP